MTYLPQKAEGTVAWAESVEKDVSAWAVPGKILRKSSLRAFADRLGGEEMGSSVARVYGDLTFPDPK